MMNPISGILYWLEMTQHPAVKGLRGKCLVPCSVCGDSIYRWQSRSHLCVIREIASSEKLYQWKRGQVENVDEEDD